MRILYNYKRRSILKQFLLMYRGRCSTNKSQQLLLQFRNDHSVKLLVSIAKLVQLPDPPRSARTLDGNISSKSRADLQHSYYSPQLLCCFCHGDTFQVLAKSVQLSTPPGSSINQFITAHILYMMLRLH